MGKNINSVNGISLGTSYREKCYALIDAGAKEISNKYFQENLICVVDNGHFAAAGYVYDEDEYEDFNREDGRPKRWFILNNAEAYVD